MNKKIGRNDPCPCDSGKKFKKCHGLNPEPISPAKKIEQERSCGPCQACCINMPIDEPDFKKDRHVPCDKLTPEGCSIYNEGRPSVCESFKCAWLMGSLPENMRPDICGMVFTIENQDLFTEYIGEAYLKVTETRPGAADTKEANEIFDLLTLGPTGKYILVVTYEDERRWVANMENLPKVVDFAEKQFGRKA